MLRPLRSAPLRSAPLRLAPGPMRYPLTSFHSAGRADGVPVIEPLETPRRFAFRSVPDRLVPERLTPARLAPLRFAPGPMRYPPRVTHPAGSTDGVPVSLRLLTPESCAPVRFAELMLRSVRWLFLKSALVRLAELRFKAGISMPLKFAPLRLALGPTR